MKKKENISKTDKENWEEYIRNPKDVFDKEGEILKNYPDNSNVKFDLHGYSLNEANSKVREIIFDDIILWFEYIIIWITTRLIVLLTFLPNDLFTNSIIKTSNSKVTQSHIQDREIIIRSHKENRSHMLFLP